MRFTKSISLFLTSVMSLTAFSNINIASAVAASPIGLPSQFAIENANNSNFVVDKFGDNDTIPANAHLYTKDNPKTYVFYGDRASNGSYEVHLKSSPNLCLTMAGGLNPNQGNGTIAVFSANCANSLNLMFFNDNTIRVSRNQNLCLTNQGNRHSNKFNKIHFWACDNSLETKWNINGNVNTQSVVNLPLVVTKPYVPPTQVNKIIPATDNKIKFTKTRIRNQPIKIACEAVCVGIVTAVVILVIDKTIDYVNEQNQKKKVYVEGIFENYRPISWEIAAKVCDTNDKWDKNGYHDFQLVWMYDDYSRQSVKTCIKYE